VSHIQFCIGKFGIRSSEHSDCMTRELVHLCLYDVHTRLTDTLSLQI